MIDADDGKNDSDARDRKGRVVTGTSLRENKTKYDYWIKATKIMHDEAKKYQHTRWPSNI